MIEIKKDSLEKRYSKFKYVDSITTVVILIIVIQLALFAEKSKFNVTDIVMIYILGILFVAYVTNGYIYGIIATICSVLSYNFFFIAPYYSLNVYNKEYIITFFIMFIVSIVVSSITVKLKKQRVIAEAREKRMEILYHLSNRMITSKNREEMIVETIKSIASIGSHNYVFVTEEQQYIYDSNGKEKMIDWIEKKTLQDIKKITNDKVQEINSDLVYFYPFIGQSGWSGLLGVWCEERTELSLEHIKLINAIRLQLIIGIEREYFAKNEQQTKIEMERERLRGNLLRSISHDLRTPLTGILGSTETLIENESLSLKTKNKLLTNISSDTKWLIHSVENILNITKVDEGKLELDKQFEVLEEIVSESVMRVSKNVKNRVIEVNIPDKCIMIKMDGVLIQQVLINLLENAMKYTKNGCKIELNTYVQDDICTFEIKDNGDGIDEKDLPYIFNQFYRSKKGDQNGRKGLGLGLAICQSIVQAHGGIIEACNNEDGGATFRFTLKGGIVWYE